MKSRVGQAEKALQLRRKLLTSKNVCIKKKWFNRIYETWALNKKVRKRVKDSKNVRSQRNSNRQKGKQTKEYK